MDAPRYCKSAAAQHFAHAVLVTLQLYALTVVADLSTDTINAYDASARLNALVKPELGMLVLQMTCLAFSGRLLLFVCCGSVFLFQARRYYLNNAEVAAAEVIQKLGLEKRRRLRALAAHALLFVACIVLLFAEALELAPAPWRASVRVHTGSVRPDHERQ